MSKSKAVQACRSINADQTQKLQAKFHFEQDLFDDIKNFANKWSALEKEYSQSLSRLANQFKTKRELPVTPILSDDLLDAEDFETVTDVWKLTLDKVDNLASSHQTLSENITTEVVETCKSQLKTRPPESKKLFEVLNNMHDDLFQSTRGLAKSKKAYCELEHEAGLCRRNVSEMQDRLSNKSQRRFFESKAQLEKKFQGLEQKLDLSEKRSTQARNEYLLSIASCNAVNELFYKNELPTFIESLDGSIYDKFKHCLESVGRMTSEAAQKTRSDFDTVSVQAARIQRAYNHQCYLSTCPVLTDVVKHAYTPYKEDPINAVSREHEGDVSLTLEARKLTSRVAQCMTLVETKSKEAAAVANLQETYTKSPELGSIEARNTADEQVFDLKESIRKLHFVQRSSEARLDVMREVGINVDEWLQSALQTEKSLGAPRDKLDMVSLQGSTSPTPRGSMASLDRIAARSLRDTSTDSFDDEFDEAEDVYPGDVVDPDTVSEFSTYVANAVRRANVLYDYTAQTDEELSVLTGHEVTVVLSSGDGWVKVVTAAGATGYIPETYIQEVTPSRLGPSVSRSAVPMFEEFQIATPPIKSHLRSASPDACDQTLVADMDADAQAADHCAAAPTDVDVTLVKSLYSYEAMEAEELSFEAGAIIRLLRKDDGVDDGWWEGELNGAVGVFPSVVVEELSAEETAQALAVSS
eukprot:scpid37329/ scgid1284/ FCH and double SH3 domains protein 2; SH3 multiple domains protein 3